MWRNSVCHWDDIKKLVATRGMTIRNMDVLVLDPGNLDLNPGQVGHWSRINMFSLFFVTKFWKLQLIWIYWTYCHFFHAPSSQPVQFQDILNPGQIFHPGSILDLEHVLNPGQKIRPGFRMSWNQDRNSVLDLERPGSKMENPSWILWFVLNPGPD